MRTTHNISVGKSEGSIHLGDLGVDGVTIKTNFEEIVCVLDWNKLSQDRIQLWTS
jgi:hypothetical protein